MSRLGQLGVGFVAGNALALGTLSEARVWPTV